MERGVVVGGLMICGSFLLAAALNRSAVKETPPTGPAVVESPIAPPLPAMTVDETKPASCAAGANDTDEPAAGDEPEQGDLPGNGRAACSQ
jgi:hypothetical protein